MSLTAVHSNVPDARLQDCLVPQLMIKSFIWIISTNHENLMFVSY